MGKSAITIIASEETFVNLSSFDSIEVLNQTVRQYKELYKDKLSKSTVSVLNHLHRFSALYKGCSFMCKNNIANALKMSRKTVIRACKALEDLGIIKQYEMKRKSDMRQTSNAIVIQPLVPQEETKTNYNLSHQEDNYSSLKQKTINKRKQADSPNEPTELDHTFVNDQYAPSEFISLAKCFYSSFDMINSLWSKVKLAAFKNNMETDSDVMLNVGIIALKTTIGQLKRKKVKDVFAYFYRVLEAKFELCYFEQLNQLEFEPKLPENHWIFA
jgi:hypothetical protein